MGSEESEFAYVIAITTRIRETTLIKILLKENGMQFLNYADKRHLILVYTQVGLY